LRCFLTEDAINCCIQILKNNNYSLQEEGQIQIRGLVKRCSDLSLTMGISAVTNSIIRPHSPLRDLDSQTRIMKILQGLLDHLPIVDQVCEAFDAKVLLLIRVFAFIGSGEKGISPELFLQSSAAKF
jgi:hypothetical protein